MLLEGEGVICDSGVAVTRGDKTVPPPRENAAAWGDKTVPPPRKSNALLGGGTVLSPLDDLNHIRVRLAAAKRHTHALADTDCFRQFLRHRIIEKPISGDICCDTDNHILGHKKRSGVPLLFVSAL
jgi:hypothetical protein